MTLYRRKIKIKLKKCVWQTEKGLDIHTFYISDIALEVKMRFLCIGVQKKGAYTQFSNEIVYMPFDLPV